MKKRRYSETGSERRHILYLTKKKPIWDLKVSVGMGGGGEAGNGGAVLGGEGTTVQHIGPD